MPKTLIIGGAGFIGFHLAKNLADQGHEITILDNFARGEKDKEFEELIERSNVDFINLDITKSSEFNKIKGEFDYIYHLAMINGTENFYSIPDKVIKVGILGTLNVLDWFIKQKKGKLLFSSSSEAYAGALKLLGDKFPIPTPEEVPFVINDPSNVRWSYGGSKALSEIAIHSYAKLYNIKNFVIIRYHNVYGPRMGPSHVIPEFIDRIIKKEDPFTIFGGEETRTFCYIDDGVKATQMVMENSQTNGQTIHMGRSDNEIKIIDLARKLFDIAGVNPSIEIKPAPKGSVKRRCPDTTKLKNLVGFEAKINLDEGLKKCYHWYKDKYSNQNT